MSVGPAQAKEPKALPALLTEERVAELEAMKPTDRFAQIGMGGWTPTPNCLLEHHDKFSGHVQSILAQEIARWTWGHERGAHDWALIKFPPLAKKSGYTAKAFELALNDAFDRGLIRRKKEGRHWLCKIVPEDLKSVKPYDRGGNPSPVPNGAARDEAGRYCLGTKPLTMSELFAGVPVEATAARFVSDVQTSRPVDVTLTVARDGIVSVLVRDAAPEVPEGSVLHKTGTHFATVRHLFASFHTVLDPIFLKLFRKVPDDAILGQIVPLCEGAPPEMLAARIAQKIAIGAFKSSGLVTELAKDVGLAWRAESTKQEADEAEARIERERQAAAQERWLVERCPDCGGSGGPIDPPCSGCGGTGLRHPDPDA